MEKIRLSLGDLEYKTPYKFKSRFMRRLQLMYWRHTLKGLNRQRDEAAVSYIEKDLPLDTITDIERRIIVAERMVHWCLKRLR